MRQFLKKQSFRTRVRRSRARMLCIPEHNPRRTQTHPRQAQRMKHAGARPFNYRERNPGTKLHTAAHRTTLSLKVRDRCEQGRKRLCISLINYIYIYIYNPARVCVSLAASLRLVAPYLSDVCMNACVHPHLRREAPTSCCSVGRSDASLLSSP